MRLLVLISPSIYDVYIMQYMQFSLILEASFPLLDLEHLSNSV